MKKDLDKKEKLLSLDREPVGKNNMSSRASFMQEKLYHQKAFSKIEFYTYSSPVDFYYDYLLYGRIDQDSNPIRPTASSLVQIRQADGIVKCQNFVNEAFNDFYNFWELVKRRNTLDENGIFYNLDYIEAYVDPLNLYKQYMKEQNEQFYSYVKQKGSLSQINTFKDFIKHWTIFIDTKTPMLPFTFSSFCVSKFSDPKISGLIIDLSDEDKTDDNKKYNKFINDPNYLFFYNSVTNFGFSVDKKIPWRIIANIDSIPMKNYLEKFNLLNSENLFNFNFLKIHLEDLKLLNLIFSEFYLEFVSANRFSVKPKINKCEKNGIKVKNEIVFKEQNIKQDQDFMIKVYIWIKARENNLSWDQATFDRICEKTVEIYKVLDMNKAMQYAHRSLNIKNTSQQKNVLFTL